MPISRPGFLAFVTWICQLALGADIFAFFIPHRSTEWLRFESFVETVNCFRTFMLWACCAPVPCAKPFARPVHHPPPVWEKLALWSWCMAHHLWISFDQEPCQWTPPSRHHSNTRRPIPKWIEAPNQWITLANKAWGFCGLRNIFRFLKVRHLCYFYSAGGFIFKQCKWICGAEHRKPLKQKIQEYETKENLKMNWTFYNNQNVHMP